ncbi:MAG: hypothetical protein KGL35_09790 [Bradyrhizobium sp.]|nr:hypothetical protein [Bradyrhizobium sp.]
MSDDSIDFDDTTPDGMKSLRKAYEKLQGELKTERENSKSLASFKRQYEIGEKLKGLGAKPGLAELVPDTVDVENVGAWLTEKADLFGWKPAEPEANPVNAAEAQAQSRTSAITSLPGDVSDDPDLAAIKAAKSPQEIAALIFERQMGRR